MLLALVICLCGVGSFVKNRKIQYLILVLTSVVLLLHLPLGRDIPTYIEALRKLPHVPTLGQGRFIFIDLWYSIFNWVFDSEETFLFAINGLTTLFLVNTIYKYSKNYALSFFLVLTSGFFAVYMQSAIRQGLVMAVLLFAIYRYLKYRK